jgi:prevent-host-death family protein
MTVLSIGEARNKLADVINRVSYGGERIVFARRGKPVAALVSADDLDALRRMEDAEDLRDAAKALNEYEHDKAGAVTLAGYKNRRKGKA